MDTHQPFSPGLLATVDLGAVSVTTSDRCVKGVVYSDYRDGRVLMHPDDLDRLRFSLEIRQIVRDGMRRVLDWLGEGR